MHEVVHRLNKVRNDIKSACVNRSEPTLIAVSKTYDAHHIEPVLQAGHRHFGENRVQESQHKWPALRAQYPDLTLHLIGPLQSNKASDAVLLFDVIHTVDREKIAKALSREMERHNKQVDVFVQINTGAEPQKAGILPDDADTFIEQCQTHHGLNVIGLMCIPPVDEKPQAHFKLLSKIAARHELPELSMGMSADYKQAIDEGATFVRVGSAIFGERSHKVPG